MSQDYTVEQLQAKLSQAREEAAAKVKNDAQVASLLAAIEVESSPALISAKTKIAQLGLVTSTIKKAIDGCKAIIAAEPVKNAKTRSDRVWSGSAKYGYGSHVGLLYTLATGITYSCNQHKEAMLMYTGLDMHTLETMIEGFGNPMYFSPTTGTLMPEVPYNVQAAVDAVNVMASSLSVAVDTSMINEDTFEKDFARGEVAAYKAETEHAEALETIAGLENVIGL